MSEASFWDYLQKVLPANGHYSRIESETAQGFPDVHYTLEGQSGTIELKAARDPKKSKPFSGEDEGLRRSQLLWMESEDDAGGVIWIFAEVGDWVYILDGNTVMHKFNNLTQAQLKRCSYCSWRKPEGAPTLYIAGLLQAAKPNPECGE